MILLPADRLLVEGLRITIHRTLLWRKLEEFGCLPRSINTRKQALPMSIIDRKKKLYVSKKKRENKWKKKKIVSETIFDCHPISSYPHQESHFLSRHLKMLPDQHESPRDVWTLLKWLLGGHFAGSFMHFLKVSKNSIFQPSISIKRFTLTPRFPEACLLSTAPLIIVKLDNKQASGKRGVSWIVW